jgi:hypothetical protein
MSLEREGERLLGRMLVSGKFWGVVAVLFVLGLFIEHPVAGFIALGCVVALGALLFYWAWRGERHVPQTLPVNGVGMPIKGFRCGQCQQLGTMHVERRELPLKSGRVAGWPVAVCGSCGGSYEVPGRLG